MQARSADLRHVYRRLLARSNGGSQKEQRPARPQAKRIHQARILTSSY